MHKIYEQNSEYNHKIWTYWGWQPLYQGLLPLASWKSTSWNQPNQKRVRIRHKQTLFGVRDKLFKLFEKTNPNRANRLWRLKKWEQYSVAGVPSLCPNSGDDPLTSLSPRRRILPWLQPTIERPTRVARATAFTDGRCDNDRGQCISHRSPS